MTDTNKVQKITLFNTVRIGMAFDHDILAYSGEVDMDRVNASDWINDTVDYTREATMMCSCGCYQLIEHEEHAILCIPIWKDKDWYGEEYLYVFKRPECVATYLNEFRYRELTGNTKYDFSVLGSNKIPSDRSEWNELMDSLDNAKAIERHYYNVVEI